MPVDGFGAEVSYKDQAAIDVFTGAARALLGYAPDPIGATSQLLVEHPDFVMARCLMAGACLVASDARFQPMLKAEEAQIAARESLANDRELGHLKAIRLWLAGDWYGASAAYADVLTRHPRDLLALLFGHQVDFLLGQAHRSHDRAARVLGHWSSDEPDGGFIQGMLAFGLEECGHYQRAEQAALAALELNPRDTWAIHGRIHCHEMQGELDAGVSFMRGRESDWGGTNYLASHNSWHLALMHIERCEFDEALALHDRYMAVTEDSVLMKMHDSCALLWRLGMAGADVGDRWAAVGSRYQEVADQAYMGFTDLHTAMAFAGTNNGDGLAGLAACLEAEGAGTSQRATIARMAALPVVKAFRAIQQRDFAAAMDLFAAHRYSSHLIGGSAAQRDVIDLTYLDCALHAGRTEVVDALLQERRLLKPESPLTQVLRGRLQQLLADRTPALS
ncbi:tetratricopeptide repeat protein [Leekyejoonella antrihumi]|uniref:Tetratricopeptide repeat protein 38 n=1 Tax=Leekyejoonella antrihumi TaxID=1660198 RepID=A0A563DS43_9MICO|nr:tetratricopeptide repeat protein [Leekyejoonella antrihumi]TWP32514.1 tetratricopeptide repeat protein [Leekyejoonella antrihumi]